MLSDPLELGFEEVVASVSFSITFSALNPHAWHRDASSSFCQVHLGHPQRNSLPPVILDKMVLPGFGWNSTTPSSGCGEVSRGDLGFSHAMHDCRVVSLTSVHLEHVHVEIKSE